ncbi:MAG: hypothetical protein LBM75_07845 [Myxococcales bacterium]|jgi:hypothetical protein|nr:hypothetical protein [Myxococcales bacterium]
MDFLRLKVCSLLTALIAILCLLPTPVGLAADKAPNVAVAPFKAASKAKQRKKQATNARAAIIKALGAGERVTFISWANVVNRAKRQYVTGSNLQIPTKVAPVIEKMGGDVVIFGSINQKNRLTLRISDKKGTILWEKTVPLTKGVLSPAMAKRFAAAIIAAAQVTLQDKADSKNPARGATPQVAQVQTREPPQPLAPDRGSSLDAFDEDPPPQPSRRESGSESVDRRGSAWSADDDDAEWKSDRRAQRDDDDDVPSGSWQNSIFGDGGPGPKLISISADVSFTWRKYKFCNGVAECGSVPVEGAGHSIAFGTDTPYLGFKLGLELFPAARVRNRYLRGFGLVAGLRMNPGIKVTYSLGEGAATELNGKEIDFSIDGTYRFYFDLGSLRNGWVGLRLGYMNTSFTIDENPLFVGSDFGGFSIGLDVGLPLARYLTLTAGFSFLPKAAPGDDERRFFSNADSGDATKVDVAADGKGFKVAGGLLFPFSDNIGLNFSFDYTRHWADFSRQQEGSATDLIPATSLEQYIGASVGMSGRF